MKAFAIIAACLLASSAFAEEVVVQTRAPNGNVIQLHNTVGPCADDAKLATHVRADGKKIQGCYTIDAEAGMVRFAWFNSMIGVIPVSMFRRPEES